MVDAASSRLYSTPVGTNAHEGGVHVSLPEISNGHR